MDFYLDNYWYILLFLLLPVIGLLLFSFIRWKKKKREAFADAQFRDQLFAKSSSFSKIFPSLFFFAILFLIFAMIDLLGGKQEIKTQQKMNNVIFLLDVSNSMNAQDIQPSRLQQAKDIIINSFQKMNNDRVGIIVFAGEANSVMPLTTDYNAAQSYITGIETSVVQTQGTDFLRAMQMAVKKFKSIPKGARKVVLISDGENNEENESAAIKLANQEGISVTTIGIGGEQGAPVPEYYYGQLMGYKTNRNGETVMTKLEPKSLKNIASSTDGVYIDGNELDPAINTLTEVLKKTTNANTSYINSQSAEHYYQYFLAISIVLFLIIYIFNPKRDLNI
ncbi:VWA domain-containing protein [Soonwooa sp.]|uniref:vWA domain-containing protein n=1 Tax=Soonwooa sp. TaxID=1938592 RepID=UPI00260C815B|nr:VWA domain-containing protein [Soonwooa sp.]